MNDLISPQGLSLIPRTAVESTRIAAIGHDPDTSTLSIEFKDSKGGPRVYHYANFPADQFEAFRNADSKGSFFHTNILHNKEQYPYVRIEPDASAGSATQNAADTQQAA